MRNSLARQILEETPNETRQFVKRYGELVARIYDLLEEKGWTQKDLAAKLDKSPSEISKWLSGEHNLTLRTLTRLEVELGEDLIQIPKTRKFQVNSTKVIHLEFARSNKNIPMDGGGYTDWKSQTSPVKSSVA
ncbi:MAG: helix-turn-helix transcriptional regulator [Saprospiraceae bacterium]|jgi:transcriptional regulator with XRE-family HTH domain|nr:helix-turn-helix transcriptional regulator [Saprospiraceae bacterium]